MDAGVYVCFALVSALLFPRGQVRPNPSLCSCGAVLLEYHVSEQAKPSIDGGGGGSPTMSCHLVQADRVTSMIHTYSYRITRIEPQDDR